jgi:uncharacterized MAPEG superfamily protein
VDLQSIATLCLVFVALRITHLALYIGNLDKLRSLIFILAYGICMYMFYLALAAT